MSTIVWPDWLLADDHNWTAEDFMTAAEVEGEGVLLFRFYLETSKGTTAAGQIFSDSMQSVVARIKLEHPDIVELYVEFVREVST